MYFSIVSFEELLIFLYGLFQKMLNVSSEYSFKLKHLCFLGEPDKKIQVHYSVKGNDRDTFLSTQNINKTSKFDWMVDDIIIEKIISTPIWAC